MTTLDSGFEQDLRDALLNQAEIALEQHGQAIKDVAQAEFESYASRHDYDIDHVWEEATGPVVERGENSVRVVVRWPGLTALFEHGVSPHTIRGSPLQFRWESPPEGTRPQGAPSFVVTDSVNWGSVTGGIPAARAIRTALEQTQSNMME